MKMRMHPAQIEKRKQSQTSSRPEMSNLRIRGLLTCCRGNWREEVNSKIKTKIKMTKRQDRKQIRLQLWYKAALPGMPTPCSDRIQKSSKKWKIKRQIETLWWRISAYTLNWQQSSRVSKGMRLLTLRDQLLPRRRWSTAAATIWAWLGLTLRKLEWKRDWWPQLLASRTASGWHKQLCSLLEDSKFRHKQIEWQLDSIKI